MVDDGDATRDAGGRAARERRLAEALRTNLKRRKEQARERRADQAQDRSSGNRGEPSEKENT